MLFNSIEFLIIFLPALIVSISCVSRFAPSYYLVVLAGFSILFYVFHTPIYGILLLSSAVFNYAIATYIAYGQREQLYRTAVAANIFVLAVFKYTVFITQNLNEAFELNFLVPKIVLPLAISFLTFEQIAFLSDVHAGRSRRGGVLQYITFITFFPKLIAGPIIRYGEFLPQFALKRRISSSTALTGLVIFSFALLKKTALADYFASISDPGFDSIGATKSIDVHAAWASFFAYPLQIYFDFSAYSEMAIGLAWMLGFRLPINFNSPYKSKNIIDFWRRWHITLSAALRDYVYIPLGGNRVGKRRKFVNLLLVMIVGGLWHGAAWTFVIWGALHGIYLLINHLFSAATVGTPANAPLPRLASRLVTLGIVCFAWVLFRSASLDGAALLLQAFFSMPLSEILRPRETGLWIACGWMICLFLPNIPQIFKCQIDRDATNWASVENIPKVSLLQAAAGAACLLTSLILILRGNPSAFIYFQF